MRFQDAAPDARAVVYAGIQADPLVARAAEALDGASQEQLLLARAAMNGERSDPATWRAMFPGLFAPAGALEERSRTESILALSLEVADRGEQARSQYRGAIVEALTERLLGHRAAAVRRERRILFDGVRAEIHPYDVTVEQDAGQEAYDCKWGARGINADVLNQLDDARSYARDEGERLLVALVVFDARRSCHARLARETASRTDMRLVTIETIGELSTRPPADIAPPPNW